MTFLKIILKTTLALAMFLAVLYYMASMGAGAGA